MGRRRKIPFEGHFCLLAWSYVLFSLLSCFPSRPRDGAGKAVVQSCLSSITHPPPSPWPSIVSSFPTPSPSFSAHCPNCFSKAIQGDLDPGECEQGGGCILKQALPGFWQSQSRAGLEAWGWLGKRRGKCGRVVCGFVTPRLLLANCSILHLCLASPHMSKTPQVQPCPH